MPRNPFTLIVFARAPVPGRCKTRLIPALGARGAAAVYRRLVSHTLAAAQASGARIELWCTPDAHHGFFIACRRRFGVRLRRQAPGDLGRRMELALARVLTETGGPAVLVGSDCPELDAADLRRAISLLGQADAVLQPSGDGGYVLIGTRRMERRALTGIAWSSGRELAQTRRRLLQLGLRVTELPARRDVDTPRDYRRARRAGVL